MDEGINGINRRETFDEEDAVVELDGHLLEELEVLQDVVVGLARIAKAVVVSVDQELYDWLDRHRRLSTGDTLCEPRIRRSHSALVVIMGMLHVANGSLSSFLAPWASSQD